MTTLAATMACIPCSLRTLCSPKSALLTAQRRTCLGPALSRGFHINAVRDDLELPEWSPKPKFGDKGKYQLLNNALAAHCADSSHLAVYIAMSGGVDSSATALLLASQRKHLNLQLQPVYMRNWSTLEESTSFEPGSGGAAGCEWQSEWQSVQAVCKHLDLPKPQLIDLSREYWSNVFEPSLEEWQAGKTPNPDVLCNQEIKFGSLVERLIPAEQRRSDGPSVQSTTTIKTWLATGHYSQIRYRDGRPQLYRAAQRFKDQSYFLSTVPSHALRHALFPLAGLTKNEVRKIAADWQLPSATRKESMGLCFVGPRGRSSPKDKSSDISAMPGEAPSPSDQKGFGSWLSAYLAPQSPQTIPGPFVSLDAGSCGEIVGRHNGLHTLTLGQGAKMSGQREKWFVCSKGLHPTTAEGVAYVVPGTNHPLLTCTSVEMPADRFTWIAGAEEGPREIPGLVEGEKVSLMAQARYRADELPCQVQLLVNEGAKPSLTVSFPLQGSQPRSVCPGQVLALYDGQRCLGSAIIPDEQEGGVIKTLGQEHHGHQAHVSDALDRGRAQEPSTLRHAT